MIAYPQYPLDVVARTDDPFAEPTVGVQYAVLDDGKYRAFGDQSWVAHGTCIEDGSYPDGKIFHRSVTVAYGEWRSVDEPERKAKPMTTYRLPDVLGGAEFELSHHTRSSGMAYGRAAGLTVAVPFDVLVEVEPPLPPEPPDGSVVWVDNPSACRVFERDGSRRIDANGRHWWVGGRERPMTWVDVCSYGTPVRLVPVGTEGNDL